MFICSDMIHEGISTTMLTDTSNSSSSNSNASNHNAVRIINVGRAGGPRLFECPKCQKGFKSKSSLKQHMHVHVSVRPYVCQACGKAYTEMTSLCRHRRKSSNCQKHSSQENKKHSQVYKENDNSASLDTLTSSKTETNNQSGSASRTTPVKYISSIELYLSRPFSLEENNEKSSRKNLHNIQPVRPTFFAMDFGLQRPLAGVYPTFLPNFRMSDHFVALPSHLRVNTSLHVNSCLNPIFPQVLKESNFNSKPVSKITNYSIENILSK